MEPGEYQETPPTPQERLQQLLETLKSGFSAAVERIGRRNLLAVGVLILLVIVGFFVYSILPRQANLTLTISELDNEANALEGAEVVVCSATASGCEAEGVQLLAQPALTEGGLARFTGLPANTPLLISVDATAQGLSKTRKTITLDPDVDNVQKIGVPRPWQISLSPTSLRLDASPGCKAELTLNATNTGDQDAELQLVSDSSLFAGLEGSKPLPVGGSATAGFAIQVPPTAPLDSTQTVGIRAKFTEAKSTITTKIGAPPSIDVTPSQIDCSSTQCSEFITIKNKGKTILRGLGIRVFEEPQVQGSITLPGFSSGTDLLPNEERQAIVSISPKGTGAGLLTVFGSCFSKDVRVKLSTA